MYDVTYQRKSKLCLCCLVTMLLWPNQVFAQFNPFAKKLAPNKSAYVCFPKDPDLPYLPKFPGSIFLGAEGLKTNPKTPPHAYSLRYELRQNPDDVIDWYGGAFESAGWTVSLKSKPKLLHCNQITATRKDEGVTCAVFVRPSQKPGYYSQLQIRYFDYPIPKPEETDKPAKKAKPTESTQKTDKH
jgi:hypothetical protein